VLEPLVVLLKSAFSPVTVLPLPVVLLKSASSLIAVLAMPVVLTSSVRTSLRSRFPVRKEGQVAWQESPNGLGAGASWQFSTRHGKTNFTALTRCDFLPPSCGAESPR
jgi:hypothetical protein